MEPEVFAWSDRAAVVVTGKDRRSWLNGLVTCDLGELEPGAARYGLLVEKKGRIRADFYAVAGKEALALAVPRAVRDELLAMLDHHLIMEDAELSAPELHWFYVAGAGALEHASRAPSAFVAALDLFGDGGALVATPDAGAFDRTSDAARFEARCIERGLPRFGAEFDATFYPQEANLEGIAVSFDKGCYLGQEVVYMLQNRGHVKKKLVPIDLEGDAPAETGAPVTTAEGQAVGDVRSSAIGPASGKPAAIAMVKHAFAKPGTTLVVAGRRATVRAFP